MSEGRNVTGISALCCVVSRMSWLEIFPLPSIAGLSEESYIPSGSMPV